MALHRYHVNASVPAGDRTLVAGKFIEIDDEDPAWGAYIRGGLLSRAPGDDEWPEPEVPADEAVAEAEPEVEPEVPAEDPW